MTSIFNKLLELAKLHVSAKFYQAKCGSSWVIVMTEKKTTRRKTKLPLLLRTVIIVRILAVLSCSCLHFIALLTVNVAVVRLHVYLVPACREIGRAKCILNYKKL